MDTPTQIDPAKVKAGDTVTLERDTALARDIVERIEPYPQGGYSIVLRETTPAYLTVTGWLVTDHQPAPKPEWKPGTTGTGTVNGESVRGLVGRTDDGEGPMFSYWNDFAGHLSLTGTVPADFVPDGTRPLPTREERASVADLLIAFSNDRLDEWDTADKILALVRGESR